MSNLPTQYPPIPAPTQDVASLQASVQALKEAVEILCGTRNPNTQGLGQAILDLKSSTSTRFGTFTAELEQVDEVSTSNYKAVSERTLTLETHVNDPVTGLAATHSLATDVFESISDPTTGLAKHVTTLETQVNDPDTGLAVTHATASDALQAITTPTTGLASRTTALETQVNDPDTGLAVTHATASDALQAITTPTTGLASRTTALETSVNDPDTGLPKIASLVETSTSTSDTVNGLKITKVLKATLNEMTGGWEFTGVQNLDGSGTSFLMKFLSNVEVDGNLLITGTVDYPQLHANSVTSAATYSAYTADHITVTRTLRSGAQVLIIATVSDTEGTLQNASFSSAFEHADYPIFVNAVNIGGVRSSYVHCGTQYLGGSAYQFFKIVSPASAILSYTVPSDGVYAFEVYNNPALAVQLGLVVLELLR